MRIQFRCRRHIKQGCARKPTEGFVHRGYRNIGASLYSRIGKFFTKIEVSPVSFIDNKYSILANHFSHFFDIKVEAIICGISEVHDFDL
jgi:hypothetical protein